MSATTLAALIFAVLLVLEWRYRLRSVRVAAAVLALLLLDFAQPIPHRAGRRAFVAPPEARITRFEFRGGRALSEYESGVLTMERAVAQDFRMGANGRRLGVAVLFWLACSPVLRRATRAADGG